MNLKQLPLAVFLLGTTLQNSSLLCAAAADTNSVTQALARLAVVEQQPSITILCTDGQIALKNPKTIADFAFLEAVVENHERFGALRPDKQKNPTLDLRQNDCTVGMIFFLEKVSKNGLEHQSGDFDLAATLLFSLKELVILHSLTDMLLAKNKFKYTRSFEHCIENKLPLQGTCIECLQGNEDTIEALTNFIPSDMIPQPLGRAFIAHRLEAFEHCTTLQKYLLYALSRCDTTTFRRLITKRSADLVMTLPDPLKELYPALFSWAWVAKNPELGSASACYKKFSLILENPVLQYWPEGAVQD